MTRAELIAELAASSPHLRQADAELIVVAIFDQITAALARGKRAEFRGFGIVTVKKNGAKPASDATRAPTRWWQWGRRRSRSSNPARKCAAGSMATASPRQSTRRNRGARFTGRSGSGFQPAMVRAHFRACALSVMPGNRWRSSTAADSSPRCW